MTGNKSAPTAIVDLFYFDAGGGHRSAMMALSEGLADTCPDWTVRPVNLQKLLEPVDPIYRAAGISSERVYNKAIQNGWTRASRTFLRALQKGIRLHAPVMERTLANHFCSERPAMVVSLIPNFNAVMFRALRQFHPDVPYVTIMTDIVDSPPHFWQEPQDQYLICGSDKAALQAHLHGWYRPDRIFKCSGMILRSSFHTPQASHVLTRESLGLDTQKRTAIIMFGGYGSRSSLDIVAHIERSNLDVQTIVMCGRDEHLRGALQKHPGCFAVPFTERVADYMRLADFFIGKPGPGSVSEALHMGLPVIVESNARTLVQERYNATWVEALGVGIAIQSFSAVDSAVAYFMRNDTLAQYQQRARNLDNHAFFEIPQILRSILTENRNSKIKLPSDKATSRLGVGTGWVAA